MKRVEDEGERRDYSAGVFCVRFTSAVIRMLILTSIDRGRDLFTLESIIKFAQRGMRPYFALQNPPPLFSPSSRRGQNLVWNPDKDGLWISQGSFTHSENSALCVFFIIIIESDW